MWDDRGLGEWSFDDTHAFSKILEVSIDLIDLYDC